MQFSPAVALTCASLLFFYPVAASSEPRLIVETHVVLRDLPQDVGGLSAIEVDETGTIAVVLSDRGTLHEGFLQRVDSKLRGLQINKSQRIRHHGHFKHPDSEGLDLYPSAELLVSTEGPARVLAYSTGKKFPEYLPPLSIDVKMHSNRGFEAVARAADGRVFALPEQRPDGQTDFPIFVFDGTDWTVERTISGHRGFSYVGADFGPDEQLYLLERAFSLLGFRTRITRLEMSNLPSEPEVLFESSLGQYHNLEGISVWTDDAGTTRIILVSDDNFTGILNTELLELVLEE